MKIKKFETKSGLIRNLFLQTLAVCLGIYILSDVFFKSDQEFQFFMEGYAQGTGATITASRILYNIYSCFGQIGCIIIFFFITVGIIYYWFVAFNTFRRYLRKEKLFKLGLVSDMDDDHKPVGLFRFLKGLFRKPKTDRPQIKTYSRRELREMKKKLQELEKSEKKNKVF